MGGELIEIPAATMALGRLRVPYAGGGYLRLFPYWVLRRAVAADNFSGRPTNVYVHPREIDPRQPRMALPLKRHFKYYVGLRTTEAKLRKLLRDYHFVAASTWISEEKYRYADKVFDVRQHIAKSLTAVGSVNAPPPPSCGDLGDDVT